jgi:phenylpropionate dioxygenase-like ring-hydroxylating dioxygenase large terminal subunit
MYPRNFWYVVAMQHEVAAGQLFARTILNEPVVLYRRSDGSVTALQDRCIHRRVSLSLGTIVGDEVQCGYHGLRFAADGQCTSIPNQRSIPPRACIRSYPVVERDGFVWIWPGASELARESEIPDFSDVCSSSDYVGRPAEALRVGAPMLFNIENVLDLSHVTFVHQKTVGTPEVAMTAPEVTITDSYVEIGRAWDKITAAPVWRKVLGWDVVKRTQVLRFWPGGNIRLNMTFELPGNEDPAQVCRVTAVGPCTPETEHSHFKFSAMFRNFQQDDDEVTGFIFDEFHRTVLEDKVLIEDQSANWRADSVVMSATGPFHGAPMIHIGVDRAPLAARRMLQKLVASEAEPEASPSAARVVDIANPACT